MLLCTGTDSMRRELAQLVGMARWQLSGIDISKTVPSPALAYQGVLSSDAITGNTCSRMVTYRSNVNHHFMGGINLACHQLVKQSHARLRMDWSAWLPVRLSAVCWFHWNVSKMPSPRLAIFASIQIETVQTWQKACCGREIRLELHTTAPPELLNTRDGRCTGRRGSCLSGTLDRRSVLDY